MLLLVSLRCKEVMKPRGDCSVHAYNPGHAEIRSRYFHKRVEMTGFDTRSILGAWKTTKWRYNAAMKISATAIDMGSRELKKTTASLAKRTSIQARKLGKQIAIVTARNSHMLFECVGMIANRLVKYADQSSI